MSWLLQILSDDYLRSVFSSPWITIRMSNSAHLYHLDHFQDTFPLPRVKEEGIS